MGRLCLARLLVAVAPFRRWRGALGFDDEPGERSRPQTGADETLRMARNRAAHVERAAARLPFALKCLPRAMTLSWILRRSAIPHCVVIATRPTNQRDSDDALHAWVEVAGEIVLGDLPGPWHEIYRTDRQSVPNMGQSV